MTNDTLGEINYYWNLSSRVRKARAISWTWTSGRQFPRVECQFASVIPDASGSMLFTNYARWWLDCAAKQRINQSIQVASRVERINPGQKRTHYGPDCYWVGTGVQDGIIPNRGRASSLARRKFISSKCFFGVPSLTDLIRMSSETLKYIWQSG